MSMRKLAVNGIKLTALSTLIITILQFIRTAALARILVPEAFGLMSMMMVVITFSQIFSDFGISNAIIQKKTINRKELSSLYWFSILIGFLIFFLLILLSPLIGLLYKEPELESLIKIFSIAFVIVSFGQQFQSLLQKELNFRLIAIIETIAVSMNTLTAVVLALLNYGVLSLVIGQLVEVTFKSTILFIVGIKKWKPSLHFKVKDLKEFLNFGTLQMGESVINYFYSNIDNILIGRFLGPTALGYYTIAYNLIILPSNKINPMVTRVAFPIFSKLQDSNDRVIKGFLEISKILSYINFPIFTGLYVIAPYFVLVIYGKQWQPSIVLIQLLIGVGILRSIGNPIGSIYLAKGRVDLGFRFNLYKLIIHVPIIYAAAISSNVKGVALTYLLLQIFYFFFSYFYLVKKLLLIKLTMYLNSFKKPMIISIIMAIAIFVSSKLINTLIHLELLFLVLLGILIYVLLFLILYKEDLKVILKYLKHR